MAGSGTISGDQDLKFWMRPTFTLGIVDVDPVVGEASRSFERSARR